VKKWLNVTIILVIIIIMVYSLFVVEESVRIENNMSAKPLIVLNEKDDYDKFTYNSIGFKLTNRYSFDEMNYDGGKQVIVGQELWLFNTFLLWGWIS